MPKIRMKATKPFKYGGRWLSVGDEFEVRGNGDARVLDAIGKAVKLQQVPALLVPIQKPVAAPRYRTTKIEPLATLPIIAEPVAELEAVDSAPIAETEAISDDQPAEVQEPAVKPAKRQYRRRDMNAEGNNE